MRLLVVGILLFHFVGGVDAFAQDKPVDFKRDVFPLLKKHCFDCHGPDAAEGKLRVDAKAIVFKGGRHGPAVVPRKPNKSLLLQRILGKGDGKRMPLEADPLTAKETAVIRAWIDQGANWPAGVGSDAKSIGKHWSYTKPKRPTIPPLTKGGLGGVAPIQNPIDNFIRARLKGTGLQPSPPASRERLIRRVTLDLTGIPPTLDEIDDFLNDRSPNAYEKVVDRLLASPRYGERWATPWLDAARYADSNGYQRDGRRSYWAYRDWVIRALNADIPFDRFTIEQLAGDLLAKQQTSRERERAGASKTISRLTPDGRLDSIVATGFHRGTMANVEAGTDPNEEHFLAVVDRVNTTAAVWLGTTMECGQCHDHKYDPFSQREYYQLYAFFNNTEREIRAVGSRRDFIGPKVELPLSPMKAKRLKEVESEMQSLTAKRRQLTKMSRRRQALWEAKLLKDATAKQKLPKRIRVVLAAKKRNAKQKRALTEYFNRLSSEYRKLDNRIKQLQAEAKKLAPPTTLVMKELAKPRMTRMFKRGDFLKPIGQPVQPGTPAVLHPFPKTGKRDRLALAKWLMSPDNPLTARVIVNRHWAAFFGRGLVTTPEDFGTQGARPTHPALLDWLATEFMGDAFSRAPEGSAASGQRSEDRGQISRFRNPQSTIRNSWSVKHLHRLIVTSATYRQSARVAPTALARDRYNAYYARGPRKRLPAELVRDNALAVSGLLSGKMHGPPVFPYQPPNVWNHIGVASNLWATSQGDDLYRRGLYIYWRRTVPYPSFVNFDAPSREACTVKRSKSNTPLQALTLLNDRAYFEMAIKFAGRILTDLSTDATPETRARWAFRVATSRRPTSVETGILVRRYQHELSRYRINPKAAKTLLANGTTPAGVDVKEHAAWTHVANVILNLDEVIHR